MKSKREEQNIKSQQKSTKNLLREYDFHQIPKVFLISYYTVSFGENIGIKTYR